jgi:hypothetical protein
LEYQPLYLAGLTVRFYPEWGIGRSRHAAMARLPVCPVLEEVLSRLSLFGEEVLLYALKEYVTHYHEERPHQGKGHSALFPGATPRQKG